jgi:hypothetical protein
MVLLLFVPLGDATFDVTASGPEALGGLATLLLPAIVCGVRIVMLIDYFIKVSVGASLLAK